MGLFDFLISSVSNIEPPTQPDTDLDVRIMSNCDYNEVEATEDILTQEEIGEGPLGKVFKVERSRYRLSN